ncbi:hypothetical protein GIB67_026860 [Kingdonia uniflora]|uniref:CRAL-TRIO domain-containing protein n=1 Tax=Kingdonia uniflora TaxID=39325 RepID=A0A7J7M7T6_9MAGN|nr:hypothetical protein GIB67_026860 [Kingdonia uniflora]
MAIKKIYGNVGSSIFKEEKTPLSQMKPVVKNALLELRRKVEDAIQGNYLLGWSEISCNCCTSNHNHPKSKECDISLWGVPLLPSKGHEGTNIILLKFLQAKDYKVYDAFTMLEKTLKWRNEFKTDAILDEEFEPGLEKMGLVDGTDKKGRPLLYTIHGALRENNLYNKLFGTDGNKDEFLRWKIQFLEKGMRKLNFKPGGVDSVILITDLKNAPGPSGKELRLTAKKLFISLFVDHYPEILYKHIVVNAPFWFYAYHATFSRVLSQRAKNNFVLARPSRVAKTLLKYIAPGNLPVHYGGLKRENDNEFSPKDCVSQIIVRGGVTDTIQIPIAEVLNLTFHFASRLRVLRPVLIYFVLRLT